MSWQPPASGYPAPSGGPGGYPNPPGGPPPYPGGPGGYPTPPGMPTYPGAPGSPPYADYPLGHYAFPGAPGPAPGLVYAGFWWRVLGYLLDSLIVGVPTAVVGTIFLWSSLSDWFNALSDYFNTVCAGGTCNTTLYPPPALHLPAGNVAFVAVCESVIAFLYFGVLVSSWGSTVGQRAIGARVVRVEDPAHRLPLERAAVRAIVFWGPGLITALLYIGQVSGLGILVDLVVFLAVLWVAWDPRKQGLHDKLGRALVVRRASLPVMAPYASPYTYALAYPTAYTPNPYLPPPQVPPAS